MTFISDKKATTNAIELLKNKYSLPEFMSLTNVWNGNNEEKRFADFFAFRLYKPHEIYGFELKSSKSDWKRERDNPRKSTWFTETCHRFWLVSTKKNIVKENELPTNWGLIEIDDKEISVLVPAPLVNNTEQVPISFLGVIMKHLCNEMSRSPLGEELKNSYDRGYKDGLEKGSEDYDCESDRLKYRVKQLEKTLYGRKNKTRI